MLFASCATATTFVRHVHACTASSQALTKPRIVLSWRKALPLGQGSTKHDHHLSPESKTLVLEYARRSDEMPRVPTTIKHHPASVHVELLSSLMAETKANNPNPNPNPTHTPT